MKKKNIDNWIKKRKEHLGKNVPDQLFQRMRKGDMSALSSGITLVESVNREHRENANELVQQCLPYSGKSIRIGITGVPGVGKSTFIETFGKLFVKQGKKVAVLAVDPTSSISGGSILGDKTRMNDLSVDENVFIRPSPAGDTLGGVARKTRESILLCEAAGFDVILIETVGVGQSETIVKNMVDFFLLLMLSGAGDELQGIKKGIMEMADAVVITKADGDNVLTAKTAAREYKNALHLFPANSKGWIPQVLTISAIENKGVEKVLALIDSFHQELIEKGLFYSERREQDKSWLSENLKEMILSDFFSNEKMMIELERIKQLVNAGELSSYQAAEKIYKYYKND